MSFRMSSSIPNNTAPQQPAEKSAQPDKKEAIVTDFDIDKVEEYYRDREQALKKMIENPRVTTLQEYRKKLAVEPTFETDKIVFDKIQNKWVVQTVRKPISS